MAGAAGALRAGRAYVEFFTDTTKFSAGLNTVQMRLRKISASIALTGASISAIGTAGAASFLPMIKAAGDFESTLALFGTVFKANTESMRDWSAQTSKALGRSQAELMGFAAEAGGVLSNVGFDDSQVIAMSQSLTRLAVDVGSLQNISDKDAFGKLLAGITGDGEALRSIGVIANEATVALELLSAGLDPTKATEAQKVFARYSLTMKQTADAQGNARENAASFSNQLKKLKSQVNDLYIAIGQPLQSALAKMMKGFEQTANAVVRLVTQNPKAVASFAQVAVIIAAVGAALVGVAAAFAGAAVVVRLIVAPFMAISTAAGLLLPLLSALLSPIGLVIAAITLLSGGIIQQIGGLQPIFDWFKAKFDEIVGVATRAVKAIMNALQKGDFGAAIEVAMAGMSVAMQAALQPIRTAWAGFTGYFKEAFAKAAYALPVIMVGVSAMIQKAWLRTTEALKSALVKNVNDVAKKESTAAFDKMEARFKELRDSGQMSEGDFKSRMEALNKARAADMTEAERIAAKDQADIDKNRADAINKINNDAKAELDSLKAQMDADVAAVRGETDSAAAEAQARLDAARKRFNDALGKAEQIPNANDGNQLPDTNVNAEELKKQLANLEGGAKQTEEVKQRAATAPLVGGERAGQVFGTLSLEEVSREQLKVQKEQLRAFDKTATYLRNVANQMSLEFQ